MTARRNEEVDDSGDVTGQRLQQHESRTVCLPTSSGQENCQTETRTREFVPRDPESSREAQKEYRTSNQADGT